MNDQSIKLAKKAIKGNQKAFEQLLQQSYEQIYRTAYLYVQNREDALDAVQESAYQAFKSIHTLKNPEYFMTWLTKIVIRCSGQLLSKKKRTVPLTDEMISSLHSSIGRVNDDSLMLMETLNKLRESYRTAIILFYYYDFSIKTISEIMELPEGTVKTHLSRGKEALKQGLEKESCHG